MNMILHGHEDADIRKGDTITNPQFTRNGQLQTFDFIVMNPPFSTKSWSNGLENDYGRFELGMPPAKNGDYAFLLHVLKSLKSNGKAAVILPHGVLFRRNAEADIRRELLKRGYIKGIIGLPPNLFYGTGIPACIIVIDKEDAGARKGVFMIDASKGYVKDGPKNRLRSQDIHKIVDVFTKQTEIERYSRMVPLSEIADRKNDYNLNLPRYIDSSEPEDTQDLQAHLSGGIPEADVEALNGYWDAFPSLRPMLFEYSRPGYCNLAIETADLQQSILDSDEFRQFVESVQARIADWFSAHRSVLEDITADTEPNALIASIGEDLLERFGEVALLDPYDVYEQLMTYWHSVMHDDVFLIMNEGWKQAATPRKSIEDKDRNLNEVPDLVIGTGRSAMKYKIDLLPPSRIDDRYFPNEQHHVRQLAVAVQEASLAVQEYVEEQAVEGGLLFDAMDEDKLTKALAASRLKDAKKEDVDPDEIKALEHVIDLYEKESNAKKLVKESQAALDLATLKKYGDLSEGDVRQCVLDEKWYKTIDARVTDEANLLTLALVQRLQQLGERYAETLTELEGKVETLGSEVAGYLTSMGLKL
jgi:type I restriction enzyme M protein